MGKKTAADVRIRPTFQPKPKKMNNPTKNVEEFQNFVKVNLSKKPDRAK